MIPPEKFNDLGFLPSFLAQLNIYMDLRPKDIPNEWGKIYFLFSRIKEGGCLLGNSFFHASDTALANEHGLCGVDLEAFNYPQKKETASLGIQQ